MCCLKPPFDASTLSGLIIKITRGEYEPIASSYSEDLQNMVTRLLVVDPEARPDINQVLKFKFLKPYIEQVYTEFEQTRRERCKQHIEQSKQVLSKLVDEEMEDKPDLEGQTIGELIESKKQALEKKLGPEKLLLLYTSMKHSEIAQHEITEDLKSQLQEILSLESFYYSNN